MSELHEQLAKVENCSACGKEHDKVTVYSLGYSFSYGGILWGHYFFCPDNHDRVYVSLK